MLLKQDQRTTCKEEDEHIDSEMMSAEENITYKKKHTESVKSSCTSQELNNYSQESN